MDSLLTAAARRLSLGDPLGALERVALRDDAPALALRGVAMAQLGELELARDLLRRAERAFEPAESTARARTTVARAEVQLAARELAPVPELASALETLEACGDRINVLHTRLLTARRLLLLGQVNEAEAELSALDLRGAPPMLAAVAELALADVATRRVRARAARAHLRRAEQAARRSGIPTLVAETEIAARTLLRPAARVAGETLSLQQVERLFASDALIVDGCRRAVRTSSFEAVLATRPVLFALARSLASAWPAPATRGGLLQDAFGVRRPNESHRARLRVEIGRLRRALASVAKLDATPEGFVLAPKTKRRVVLLAPPIDGDAAALLALLHDGQAWSTSSLALALGSSQRTVQRALSELAAEGKVQSLGRGRTQRWLAPPAAGFTTILLLPTTTRSG